MLNSHSGVAVELAAVTGQSLLRCCSRNRNRLWPLEMEVCPLWNLRQQAASGPLSVFNYNFNITLTISLFTTRHPSALNMPYAKVQSLIDQQAIKRVAGLDLLAMAVESAPFWILKIWMWCKWLTFQLLWNTSASFILTSLEWHTSPEYLQSVLKKANPVASAQWIQS